MKMPIKYRPKEGDRHGELTVIREEAERRTFPSGNSHRMILCRCSCGVVAKFNLYHIVNKHCHTCVECYRKRNKAQGQAKINPTAMYDDLWRDRKNQAWYRGLEFTLTKEEFRGIIVKPCFYCGSPPSNRHTARNRRGHTDLLYNGLERLDSSKGYNNRNVVAACWICNHAKMDLSVTEFIAWIQRVNKHLQEAGF